MWIYNNVCTNYDFINESKGPYKNYLQMDEAMKKLFSMKNPRPIIDFLNSIYGDNIRYDAKIYYSDKQTINKKEDSNRLMSFYADMYINIIDINNTY